MGKVLAVVSGKSGMGKTTVAASLSACFAAQKYKTLCLYFGTGSRKSKFALGMTDNVYPGDIDELNTPGRIVTFCTEHSRQPGLYILSIPVLTEPDKPDILNLKPMFKEIRRNFDYCLVDTPPVSDAGFKQTLSDADFSIIVTTFDSPVITDALIAARHSLESGVRDFRLFINRIHPKDNENVKAFADKICNTINAKLIGLIPEEELISHIPLTKDANVTQKKRIFMYRFLSVARGIVSENIDTEDKEMPPPPLQSHKVPDTSKKDTCSPDERPKTPDERPKSPDEEAKPPDEGAGYFEMPSNFLGRFGDPKLWARSTLKHAKSQDLVAIHSIQQGGFIGSESIRDRMWLHDLLDDKQIPYYIEVGCRDGSKDLTEAQYIYVEQKNVSKAIYFIKQFNDPSNIVREDIDKDDPTSVSDDGIPQKTCTSCGKKIDFDHHKCPYCKKHV